jgi:predicted nucleic acid-binding protein
VARRLILDTGVIIAIKRGKLSTQDVYGDADDIAVAAVTIAELAFGALLAPDPARRTAWTEHAMGVARTLRVLPYTVETALRHGELLATTRAAGFPRGALDLVIAAHAAETSRVIVTRDGAARFDQLPGVRALTVP